MAFMHRIAYHIPQINLLRSVKRGTIPAMIQNKSDIPGDRYSGKSNLNSISYQMECDMDTVEHNIASAIHVPNLISRV